MAYAVSILPDALKALEKLTKQEQRRVAARIDKLAEEPRPSGAESPPGRRQGLPANPLRRSGDHRIVYRVEDKQLSVLVVRVGHRREVYRW